MPILKWFPPQGSPHTFVLHKPVTTVGRGLGNDVALTAGDVADTHAQVLFDGRDFNLEEIDKHGEILINGKKKRRARLVHGDRLTLGDAELSFSMFDEPLGLSRRPPPSERTDGVEANTLSDTQLHVTQQLAGLRKLYEFSETLMTMKDIEHLLEAMLDAVIEVTGAEKGLILLHDDAFVSPTGATDDASGRPARLRASRNVRREAITDTSDAISDSIVRKVVETGRPVIVSDALSDAQFGTSESVLALRLSSVMCAPLVSQGHVQGVLYVGNDRVKGLFERNQLDVLSIFAAQASLILQNALLLNALRADKEKLVAELKDKRFGEIIGACPSMLEVFRKLQKVATTDISVLITGETGTGKELIAREIHRRSGRANGPIVVINCGAIPENLIESELFGHVKGAFTGAIASRAGKFQAANGGTLFLDEIGELPSELQPKLLRALEKKEIRRIGSNRTTPFDVRVLAATNRNLENEVRQGNFREDLFFRLATLHVLVPPLRDRLEDLPLLIEHFLGMEDPPRSREAISAQVWMMLKAHSWPGNVRELRNVVRRLSVTPERAFRRAARQEQPELSLPAGPLPRRSLPLRIARSEAIAAFESSYVEGVLEEAQGNVTRAATIAEVSRQLLTRLIRKYGLREKSPESST